MDCQETEGPADHRRTDVSSRGEVGDGEEGILRRAADSDRVRELIELLGKGDQAGVERVAKEISIMEGKADDAKNAARSTSRANRIRPGSNS